MSMGEETNIIMQKLINEYEKKGIEIMISDPKNDLLLHKKECTCAICNNEIREERQYGALEVKDGIRVIIDAEEFLHLNKYFESTDKKQPEFPQEKPKDRSKPVLAYGVLIPQYDAGETDWYKELDIYRNFALGTLENEKLYLSAYSDYELFMNDAIYARFIPCALLLDTVLDLSVEREYGFGYTTFILYKNMEILDNILNRSFLFCLGGLEKGFVPEDKQNWKKYISKVDLLNVAKRLF